MSGRLAVVGLGPGDARYLTPQAQAALAQADALYGYGPYLARVPERANQARHASDNREERARAAAALDHAAQGARVAVVSGGDPGVFAMWSAAVWRGDRGRPGDAWRALEHRDHTGHHRDARGRRQDRRATRARLLRALALRQPQAMGSDRAPPRRGGERRIFVIALYIIRFRGARPWQFGAAIELLRRHLPPRNGAGDLRPRDRPCGRGSDRRHDGLRPADTRRDADMATLIIIGRSRETRRDRPAEGARRSVYTPARRKCARSAHDRARSPAHPRHGRDGGRVGQRRSAQHDHFDADRPRRADLAVGGIAAAVLGDDDVDAVRLVMSALTVGPRRTAPRAGHVGHVRQRQRRIDRIDTADEIMVSAGLARMAPTPGGRERDEDAARRLPRAREPPPPRRSTSIQRSPG